MELFVHLLSTALASLGFALLFGQRPHRLPISAFGGLLCRGAYLLLLFLGLGTFSACLLSSLLAAVYAECMAIRVRAPATVFLVPTIIPAVPGGSLFYAVQALARGDFAACGTYAMETALFAFGIAAGIAVGWMLFFMLRSGLVRRLARKQGGK